MAGYPCCCQRPGVDCEACQSGTSPREAQVVLADLVDDQCDDCAALAGTYVLRQVETHLHECLWQYDNPALGCGFERLQVGVITSVIGVFVYAQLGAIDGAENIGTPSHRWQSLYAAGDLATRVDCGAISGLSLDFQFRSDDQCQSGGTCLVTLPAP